MTPPSMIAVIAATLLTADLGWQQRYLWRVAIIHQATSEEEDSATVTS